MNKPTIIITEQQVARRMKTSVKFLKENPQLLETCRSVLAARDSLKGLKNVIREKKKHGESLAETSPRTRKPR